MVVANFITSEELQRGLVFCAGLKSQRTYGERVGIWRFGGDYPYPDHVVSSEFPPYLAELAEAITPVLGSYPVQITVNKYAVGGSIPPHIDKGGEIICVLSLGAAEMMLGDELVALPNRSLLILQGHDRWNKKHAILPVKTERYSIVFR